MIRCFIDKIKKQRRSLETSEVFKENQLLSLLKVQQLLLLLFYLLKELAGVESVLTITNKKNELLSKK